MNIAAFVEEIEARVRGMRVRDAPALRTLRREYSQRIKSVPAGDVVKIAAALIVDACIASLATSSSPAGQTRYELSI